MDAPTKLHIDVPLLNEITRDVAARMQEAMSKLGGISPFSTAKILVKLKEMGVNTDAVGNKTNKHALWDIINEFGSKSIQGRFCLAITDARLWHNDVKSVKQIHDFMRNGKVPINMAFSTTGRVYYKDPIISSLSRVVRPCIVVNEIGNERFLTVDFRAFEAGVAVGLSGDEDALKVYNETKFEQNFFVEFFKPIIVWPDGPDDDEVIDGLKTLFYGYLYGGKKSISSLATNFCGSIDEFLSKMEQTYPKFTAWSREKDQQADAGEAHNVHIHNVVQTAASEIVMELYNSLLKSEILKPYLIIFDEILLSTSTDLDSSTIVNEIERCKPDLFGKVSLSVRIKWLRERWMTYDKSLNQAVFWGQT